MTHDPSDQKFNYSTTRTYYVNFWSSRRARLDSIVDATGVNVVRINRDSPETMFSSDRPDAVIIGFGKGARDAATFIANYRSSPWFRRVPLIALVESRDEGILQLCMEWGCDDAMLKPIRSDQLRRRIRLWSIRYRLREKEREAADRALRDFERAAAFADVIVPLGVAMMAEDNFESLLEMILAQARKFCAADGGTIYLLRDDRRLEFKIMVNESLGVVHGAQSKSGSKIEPLALPAPGSDAPRTIAAHVASTGETVNLEDVFAQSKYDVSGVRAFDSRTGYRTRSILTIALRDHAEKVIGVLQLINATDRAAGKVVAFDALTQRLIESLSRLAGQALDSYSEMARLRKQADALSISIDERETSKQVNAIATSTYFINLKAKAIALRDASRPNVPAGTR